MLGGCSGPRDDAYDPTHFRIKERVLPAEIVRSEFGVYAQKTGGTDLCCWIATRARIVVKKAFPAKRLFLTVYVPDAPLFRASAQTLTVSFPGTAARRPAMKLGAGFQTISVPVPPALQFKTADQVVQIDAGKLYTTVKTSGGASNYAVVLTSVYFR